MKRVMLLAALLAIVAPASGEAQVADSLREQVRIREIVLEGQLRDLGDARQQLRELWSQLEQQSGSLLRAQQEGETVDSLRLRDDDLRRIESEFVAAITRFQQERRATLDNRTMLAALSTEVERLSVSVGDAEAPLTGTWRLVVEPGQDGLAYFQQQGTLVTGTYALSGGFSGSFRGTLVAGKVRLERIDSQIGFAAIFYGRLVGQGRNLRLQGNWEATQLASGLASAGNWTGAKVQESE
jgi:putative component of toxin-antitoxin plasmid stabilization module